MIDIDKLEQLPSKLSSRKAHIYDSRYPENMYYRSWSKMVNGLDKVKLDKFVGRHIDEVFNLYRHRVRSGLFYWTNSVYAAFLNILGFETVVIEDGVKYIKPRWGELEKLSEYRKWNGRPIFYIHPETGIICVYRRKSQPVSYRKKTKIWRQKAEETKATEKSRRDKKKEREVTIDHTIDLLYQKRKRKEKALNDQKMIAKGFDPITSFRNVPRAA